MMFMLHARRLAERGHRCVLIDLPGHGARMDEPLSLGAAVSVVVEATLEHVPAKDGCKPILMGGSLGGYVSMEVLGSHPGLFDGAVIAMSGQNVGRGRGFQAKVGLAAMAFVMPLLAPETMMQKMAE